MANKTRDKLIDVARQLFVHKGVERTTMNDIAEASSKGRRTIYTYFKNKKEIYNAVLEKESDRMVEELREIATDARPVEDRFVRFLRKRLEQGVDFNTGNNSFRALFKFDLRRMQRIRQLAREKERVLLHGILSEGVKSGIFIPERAKLIDSFLVRCIQGIDMSEITSDETAKIAAVHAALIEYLISTLIVDDNSRSQSSKSNNSLN